MLFNKLTCHLVFAVLLVAGLAFVATPATAAVTPVLSAPDADAVTTGIQVYGIRAETVTFELTVTFQDDQNNNVATPVTGFDATDIVLTAANSNGGVVPRGATASPVRANPNGSVYATTITANDNVSTVLIDVPVGAADTLGTLDLQANPPAIEGQEPTEVAERAVVHIVRSVAPPLTLSEDRSVSGTAPFTVTLTSTEAITLTSADIKVTNGFIPTNGISSDAAKKVWTVTITPGVSVTEITVEAAVNGAYIFPKGTFTVDTAGPVATITGTPPIGGGPFAITIAFNEPLRTGTTLLISEITVIGGSISVPFSIPSTNSYVTTLTPSPGVTTVAVQVSAGAVADVGGIQNSATPAPAHFFTVAATTGGPSRATGFSLDVIFSEIANRNNNANEWIEFKNTSSTPQNVNGWIVSIVTQLNSDEFLFQLPNVTIPAGGVLLVTDKNPEDVGSSLAKDSPLWRVVNMGALPNEGNFMLVLRKSSDRAHLGTANHIVDVAGYYPSSAQGATQLWPLLVQSAPFDKNNLKANRVYWRQHENVAGTGGSANTDAAVAFQPVGYTGVGYERAAAQTDENGGTPGYPNDVRHGNVEDLTGDVTISEIMFTTDGSANEVQWIELYNSSKTEAVALDADNGWSLIIENYIDPDSRDEPLSGEINFKDDGDVKTILPNQTVLIVSSVGRNSDRNHFPSNRVFDVYAEVGDEFDMNSKRDPFLNSTSGFYIELADGKDSTADEVGNFDLRSRRVNQLAWELPMGRTEDGDRTSIIRRYRQYSGRTGRYSSEGVVQDGTEREGWIPAANTDFRDFSRDNSTWYGSDTDYGTPGLRAGQALPVQLSQFRPDRTETGTVVIQWTTESEMDNAGFNILRSQTRTGEFKVINAQLIPGAGTTAERNTYTWTDTTAKPNVVYYYQIEDVSFDGERQALATVRLRGLVSAKGKLTTQWGELKQSRD